MEEKFEIFPLGEVGEYDRLYRDLKMLYRIRKGSLPINRDFGIDWGILSHPVNEVQSDFTLEIMEQTEKYVPEVNVSEVRYENGEDGKVIPHIFVKERGKNV